MAVLVKEPSVSVAFRVNVAGAAVTWITALPDRLAVLPAVASVVLAMVPGTAAPPFSSCTLTVTGGVAVADVVTVVL